MMTAGSGDDQRFHGILLTDDIGEVERVTWSALSRCQHDRLHIGHFDIGTVPDRDLCE